MAVIGSSLCLEEPSGRKQLLAAFPSGVILPPASVTQSARGAGLGWDHSPDSYPGPGPDPASS